MGSVHIYEPYKKVTKEMCITFFKVCEELQKPKSDFGVHYLDIMKGMHVGFDRLQNILISISRNWGYFKVHYGYSYRGWVVNVDMHKRIIVDGTPMLYLRVNNTLISVNH